MYNNATSIERCLSYIDDNISFIYDAQRFDIEKKLLPSPFNFALEVIVVNDGSTDRSQSSVLNIVQNRNINFVYLFEQPHKGAAAARNYGLSQARGSFVWFVDADDFISLDALLNIIPTLKDLALDVDLFKMGTMKKTKLSKHKKHPKQVKTKKLNLPAIVATPRSTQEVFSEQIFGTYLGTLDHTTYIFRRNFLIQQKLHYPEGMHLLEDSLFVLQCLECTHLIQYNYSFRFYNFCNKNRNSTTRRRWNREQCSIFVPNIIFFFREFRAFVENNFKSNNAPQKLYDRYLYVYLRVLAVKGCPWSFISSFRHEVAIPNTFYYGTSNRKMKILRNERMHAIFSTMCRIVRPT